ncbi:DNA (cytosine-5)-methyltransferase 3 like [Paralvinella palmiformis]|uniref:DNA (Cytosine-5)-methyltransferase 3 like n=1 Tax=Paralvinella palmiformis TaxID=53620 RepID=A0AAD9IR38_9ANNE|nr:DNA (cytosine-5)-methyltransferase 3 like [Paralvinella palmiformis]
MKDFVLIIIIIIYASAFLHIEKTPKLGKGENRELYQTNNDSIEEECSDDAPECSFRIEKKNLGGNLAKRYCIICGNGGKLFVCDEPDCRKVYCTGCITALVGPECVDLIENTSVWKCYLCSEFDEQSHGLLEKKPDWFQNIIDMYQPDECFQVNMS